MATRHITEEEFWDLHGEQQILIEAGKVDEKWGYAQQYIAPIDGKYWAFWVRVDMSAGGFHGDIFAERGFDATEVKPVSACVTEWVPVEDEPGKTV